MENFKFYIINLEKSKDRWMKIKNMYQKDLVHRIDAYDGNILHNYNDLKLPEKYHITDYELACSCSHIKAIKEAYENDEDEVFILEDDILNTYKHLWHKNLKTLVHEKPDDCSCLIFFNISPEYTNKMIDMKETYVKYHHDHWSTGCYYLNRKGIKNIYNLYVKDGIIDLSNYSNYPNDELVSDRNLIYSKLNAYNITKPTFIDECKTSHIHPEHIDIIHIHNNNIIRNYFTKINNWKYFKIIY